MGVTYSTLNTSLGSDEGWTKKERFHHDGTAGVVRLVMVSTEVVPFFPIALGWGSICGVGAPEI